MSGNGAQVGVLPLLQGDDELRGPAWPDQRRLPAVDTEVVQDVANVLEDEHHLAGLRDRLGREPQEELAAPDLDGWRLRGCRPVNPCGGQWNQGEGADRDRRERRGRASGLLLHCDISFWD